MDILSALLQLEFLIFSKKYILASKWVWFNIAYCSGKSISVISLGLGETA